MYGTGRASPRSFAAHHLAAISAAIVSGDSATLRAAAQRLNSILPLTFGDFLVTQRGRDRNGGPHA